MLGTFVFPDIDDVDTAAVLVPGAGARFADLIACSDLPAWFEESLEGRFCASCVCALGKGLSGTGSTMGGKAKRDAKAELDPGVFFAELFGRGVLVAAAVVTGCADVFAGDAGAGAAV
jgi:hypothetical protein